MAPGSENQESKQMPIYEYGCNECGHFFEELQRSTDPSPERCPSCGAEAVERVISRSSFLLRGGGWYAQDYSSTPPASGASGGAAEKVATGTGDKATGGEKAKDSSTGSTPKAKPAASSAAE